MSILIYNIIIFLMDVCKLGMKVNARRPGILLAGNPADRESGILAP